MDDIGSHLVLCRRWSRHKRFLINSFTLVLIIVTQLEAEDAKEANCDSHAEEAEDMKEVADFTADFAKKLVIEDAAFLLFFMSLSASFTHYGVPVVLAGHGVLTGFGFDLCLPKNNSDIENFWLVTSAASCFGSTDASEASGWMLVNGTMPVFLKTATTFSCFKAFDYAFDYSLQTTSLQILLFVWFFMYLCFREENDRLRGPRQLTSKGCVKWDVWAGCTKSLMLFSLVYLAHVTLTCVLCLS